MKQNKAALIIILVTLVLAGVAVFTALRLYQLRQEPVAPNVPQSTPGATSNPTTDACEAVAFTLEEESPTPTPSSTPQTSNTPVASSTPVASTTPRPSTTSVATIAPTPAPTLPPAGVATPTLVGIGAAIILLIGAFALAL